LVEVDDFLFFDLKDLIGPEGAADMDIHVVLVRDQTACDLELTLLLAE
jgi:hypothetical protein